MKNCSAEKSGSLLHTAVGLHLDYAARLRRTTIRFLSPIDFKEDNYFSAQLEDLHNEGKLIKLESDKTSKLIRFRRNPDDDPNT